MAEHEYHPLYTDRMTGEDQEDEEMDDERDYLAEALRIIRDERTKEHPMLMMPERAHLLALAEHLPSSLTMICAECGIYRPDDDRVRFNMKCSRCSYGL